MICRWPSWRRRRSTSTIIVLHHSRWPRWRRRRSTLTIIVLHHSRWPRWRRRQSTLTIIVFHDFQVTKVTETSIHLDYNCLPWFAGDQGDGDVDPPRLEHVHGDRRGWLLQDPVEQCRTACRESCSADWFTNIMLLYYIILSYIIFYILI